MTEENRPARVWVRGDKAFPDGHIVPDIYKGGILYIEHSAYAALEAELASLQAENERLHKVNVDFAVEHPCYKLSKELEKENAAAKEEINRLTHELDYELDKIRSDYVKRYDSEREKAKGLREACQNWITQVDTHGGDYLPGNRIQIGGALAKYGKSTNNNKETKE
jgi:triphosphoribosyl-dephospho-CoA synthetase